MLDKIRTYIEVHHLLDPFQPVAVALSGGADSVTLLHILHRLGYQVTALHCNFHLRGAESDRDEQFVRGLCQDLDIPLKVKDFDTTKYAEEQHLSIEMAARDLRYRWFAEESYIAHRTSYIAHRTSYIPLAVAHHQDDQAETLLLNLIRGTGLRGLRGMLPQTTLNTCGQSNAKLTVIRPLLCVKRQEILAYLEQEHLAHVEDSTNRDTHIRRNLIRHELIPLLQRLNPAIVQTLSEESEQFQDYYRLAQERLQQFNVEGLQTIAAHPAAETILYNKLQPYGFQPDVVRQLARTILSTSPYGGGAGGEATGKRFLSPTHTAEIHRGQLLIYPNQDKQEFTNSLILDKKILDKKAFSPSLFRELKPNEALFDADKLHGKLTLRHWQQGDTFAPFGMHGRRQKVSDYFTDHHFSLKQKEDTLLLLCDQEIAWIIGHRTSELFRIDDRTQTIVRVTLH